MRFFAFVPSLSWQSIVWPYPQKIETAKRRTVLAPLIVRYSAPALRMHRFRKYPSAKRLFSQLFLCLSRACLGKMMAFVLSNGAKMAFLTAATAATLSARTYALFLSFFLCLSRACLGKTIILV